MKKKKNGIVYGGRFYSFPITILYIGLTMFAAAVAIVATVWTLLEAN